MYLSIVIIIVASFSIDNELWTTIDLKNNSPFSIHCNSECTPNTFSTTSRELIDIISDVNPFNLI